MTLAAAGSGRTSRRNHVLLESANTDAEFARRRRPVAAADHQRLHRHLASHPERTRLPYRRADGWAGEFRPDLGSIDKVARAAALHDREPRDQVMQLAHVARKRIAAQRTERAGREAQAGRRQTQKACGEQPDIGAAVT